MNGGNALLFGGLAIGAYFAYKAIVKPAASSGGLVACSSSCYDGTTTTPAGDGSATCPTGWWACSNGCCTNNYTSTIAAQLGTCQNYCTDPASAAANPHPTVA